MRVGYFGGSFDPPHRGHLAVACAARDRFHLDRVLLAPTGRQPLKPGGPTASFADRLHMTELLCLGQPGLEPSAVDAPRPGGAPNYTIDTLRRLLAELATQYPAQPMELFAILGADAFQHLPQWREPAELFRLAEWIIVSRPGYDSVAPAQLAQAPMQRGRVHELAGIADPTSATALRRQLSQGQIPPQAFPEALEQYLCSHPVYTGQTAFSQELYKKT